MDKHKFLKMNWKVTMWSLLFVWLGGVGIILSIIFEGLGGPGRPTGWEVVGFALVWCAFPPIFYLVARAINRAVERNM